MRGRLPSMYKPDVSEEIKARLNLKCSYGLSYYWASSPYEGGASLSIDRFTDHSANSLNGTR